MAPGARQRKAEAPSFGNAAELDPGSIGDWLGKGAACLMLERYEDAVKAFEKVTDLEPENAEAWYFKGAAYHKLGQTQESYEAYQRSQALGYEE